MMNIFWALITLTSLIFSTMALAKKDRVDTETSTVGYYSIDGQNREDEVSILDVEQVPVSEREAPRFSIILGYDEKSDELTRFVGACLISKCPGDFQISQRLVDGSEEIFQLSDIEISGWGAKGTSVGKPKYKERDSDKRVITIRKTTYSQRDSNANVMIISGSLKKIK